MATPKLLLFYLTDDRRHYTFEPFVKLLSHSTTKNEWELLILSHSYDQSFYTSVINNINDESPIRFQSIYIEDSINNYLEKVKYAIANAKQRNIPYMMKCDNDIFLHGNTLDYMIANLDKVLSNPKHLTLSPILTTGIPTVEYFKKGFMDASSQEELERHFLATKFYNRDGAIYEGLNQHTLNHVGKWDPVAFFTSVKHLDHHYKGVHPVRFNFEALNYINQYILANKTRFFYETKPTGLITQDTSPYLCDSAFCIRTDNYNTLVEDETLYVDAFDEVPLNKYAWMKGMNHVFVENGYAMHLAYNWMDGHIYYEQNLTEELFQK